ncbi:MAG: hypothetical protein LBS33_07745, partial [Streptococcaceae bacterium]|nr:hypothetical protein [Streptococcaceae bacterium]
MILNKVEFSRYITNFDLKDLFINLGWNKDNSTLLTVQIGKFIFSPHIIADKNGFKIIQCQSDTIPSYAIRLQLATYIKKFFHDYIIIFFDTNKTEQIWLYYTNINSYKKKVEVRFKIGQDIERLYQRASGMIFELDDEDNITIVDVKTIVRSNFAANAEKVTKRFYDSFNKRHTSLLGCIDGIQSQLDRSWYASIMLNRLIFCYFMQRRGFLNRDRNYLRNKLKESKEKLGNGKFYSFYRSFLLILFQKGFATVHH